MGYQEDFKGKIGRNHHTVGMRVVSNIDCGYPNTRGHVTPHAATITAILREDGCATFITGKWHLAPMEEASTRWQTWIEKQKSLEVDKIMVGEVLEVQVGRR